MRTLTVSFLRHGVTPGNLRGAFVGSVDQPLAPEGRAAVETIAATGGYPPVGAVFSSPMQRCLQTAGILYPGLAIQPVEGLRERCFGEFEGKTHAEIIALPGYGEWGMAEQSMQFPGGEEKTHFFDRCCAAFWQAVAAGKAQGKSSIAVVAHGGVIMAVMEQYAQPKRAYFDWHCSNACGYLVEADAETKTLTLLQALQGLSEL